jgi:hypothetical protein
MKLTFTVAAIALLIIAGTTTICLSGALDEHSADIDATHATSSHWIRPHLKIYR